MATLDFPVDPIVGQEYEFKSYTYQWDGEKWKTIGTGSNPTNELRKELKPSVLEALRRSYAEAGYNLVNGSFEKGGVLTSNTDALLYEKDGKAYAWAGVYPNGGYVVVPETDPSQVVGFSHLDTEYLNDVLKAGTGAEKIGNGSGSVAAVINHVKPLSYYGNDSSALIKLLTYAKETGSPIKLTSDVTISSVIDIDFGGALLNFDFAGHSLLSDIECIVLRNIAPHSELHAPSLKNVTPPWCITRWNGDSWVVSSSAVLASLKQTNDVGYYQPSANDNDIWTSLSSSVQNQNISAKMRIVSSTDVKIYNPKGRFCLYEFEMCHRCEVFNPDIQSGGKGSYGTIVFKNLNDTGYGVGNKVHGGRVAYGTYSSVCFMRNKKGGVDGGFVPYRSGESGVKTYQNEVSGRSARCYNMLFSDIFPYQTVFDGVDLNSDYGPAGERVDDFTLAQYPWNALPTAHTIRNIQSNGCRQIGVWGDGQYNSYTDISAHNCLLTGIWLKVKNSDIGYASANECNISNTAGYNQITVEGDGNKVSNPFVSTTSAITAGIAIYIAGQSILNDEKIVGAIAGVTASNYGTKRVDKLVVGSGSTTENSVAIDLHPRGSNLANGAGELSAVIQIASSGSETGYAELKGRAAGELVHGVKALPNAGGIGLLAVGSSINGSWLSNNEIVFYQYGTSIFAACKLSDGTLKTAMIIS